jgi:hypothetical protein
VHANGDVRAVQRGLEDKVFAEMAAAEAEAARALHDGDKAGADAVVAAHSAQHAASVMGAYSALFETLIARYHDGYRMADADATVIDMQRLFYPKWWLKVAGFWNYPKAPPVPALEASALAANPAPSWGLLLLTNAAVGLAAAYAGLRHGRKGERSGYTAILDKPPVPAQAPFHVQIEL